MSFQFLYTTTFFYDFQKLAHQIIENRKNMEMTEKQKQDEEMIKTKMDEYNKVSADMYASYI